MKRSICNNKIFLYTFVFVFIICSVLMMFPGITGITFADDNISFDDSNVLEDLESSTVNGQAFDFLTYCFDETKQLQIINVVEYCYSYKANMRGNYALYVYIYNPKGIDLLERSGQNKIQMAVSWSKDSDGVYYADRYEKFSLKFCNKSERANYKGLFYKYKVIDREIDGKTMAERVNSMERRYDISGIELVTRGDSNATEYGVGGTYKFTGYAQGYGDSDESTLSCVVEDLETLTFEIHHTYYRTNVSSLGKNHYNEVNTVYFSVPGRIFETYGNLQKIHAEWWEYKTKKALVLNDKDCVDFALKYAGQEVGERNSDNDALVCLYNNNIPFRADSVFLMGSGVIDWSWTFNVDLSDDWKAGGVGKAWERNSASVSTILPLVFYSPAEDVDEVFDFLYSTSAAGNVNSSVVADYIYNYSNDLGHGYVDCNGRSLSKDLFEDYVDSGRTMGYNNVNIDLSDTFDLISYDSNHSWWDKLWDFGFSWPSTDGDYKDVKPIEVLDEGILTGSAEDYLINKDDLSDLREFYLSETLKGNKVVVFRFANTDYYCESATMTRYDDVGGSSDGYVAQMTCFFDFDVIDLTFNKDGSYVVIPAVSSPIDVINDVTSPPAEREWWKIVLMVLALILFVVLLAPILPYVMQALIWIIKLPFKLIKGIVKGIKRSCKKNKD